MSEQEIIKRYIYEVERKVSYDKAPIVKEDILEIISTEKKKGKAVEEILEELGSPGTIASQYDRGGNFLISDRNYNSYRVALFTTSIAGVIASIISNYGEFQLGEFLNNSIKNLIIVFLSITFGFYISEKVHVYREMKNLIDWKIMDLFKNRRRLSHTKTFPLIFAYTIFYLLIADSFESDSYYYRAVVIMYVVNLLPDILLISNRRYESDVIVSKILCAILILLGFIFLIKVEGKLLTTLKILLIIFSTGTLLHNLYLYKKRREQNDI